MQLQIRSYGTVTSTMDLAIEAAEGGAPEGLVIVADEQTAGRGRRGHSWSSPARAGLYISFVLRPPIDAQSGRVLSLVTLAAGVAVRSAIEQVTSIAAQLKWPNDIMVGRRKLAGILAEGVGLGSPAHAVILGVGINVMTTLHPDDVAARATTIETECGRPVDRALLLDAVIHSFDGTYERLRSGEVDGILRAWRLAAPSANGADVEWETASGSRRGTTAGIDELGALLVRTDRAIERVIGGEIRWL